MECLLPTIREMAETEIIWWPSLVKEGSQLSNHLATSLYCAYSNGLTVHLSASTLHTTWAKVSVRLECLEVIDCWFSVNLSLFNSDFRSYKTKLVKTTLSEPQKFANRDKHLCGGSTWVFVSTLPPGGGWVTHWSNSSPMSPVGQ